jgi:hypothetical protein
MVAAPSLPQEAVATELPLLLSTGN